MAPADQRRAGEAVFESVARVMRRRWPVLLVCVVGAAGAALAFSQSQEKKYEASASILFRGTGFDEALFGPAFSSSDDPERAAATNVELVSLGAVADRTAARLDFAGLSGGDVAAQTSVDANPDSDIASVTATNEDPDLAARIANAFAAEFIAFRRERELSRVRQARSQVSRALRALPPAQQAGPRGRRLMRQSQELASFATLRTGDAEVVQRARPNNNPVEPTPRRDVAVGLMLGLFLGLGLTFLLEQLNRRLRDEEEVEQVLGMPILATVAHRRSGRKASSELQSHDTEAFRTLRANLRYFDVGQSIRSVLITSPNVGDGKSTVAFSLAVAQRQVGLSVLLIEADLRMPTLAARAGLPADSGLSVVLAGMESLDEAILKVQAGSAEFDVLPAGPVPPNAAELIESPPMSRLLETAQESYDFVVVDAPPPVIVPDAIPLMSKVSGVIVVARLKHTARQAARDLRQRLYQLRAPVLGVVINGGRPRHDLYRAPPEQFRMGAEPEVAARADANP